MKIERSCETCDAWAAGNSDQPHALGECRRKAPEPNQRLVTTTEAGPHVGKVVAISEYDRVQPPQTPRDYWCLEWTKRPA